MHRVSGWLRHSRSRLVESPGRSDASGGGAPGDGGTKRAWSPREQNRQQQREQDKTEQNRTEQTPGTWGFLSSSFSALIFFLDLVGLFFLLVSSSSGRGSK